MDLVVKNGTLVTANGLVQTDLGIVDSRIAGMAHDLMGPRVIDASGCYVLPGGIDPHVHLQMPTGDICSSDDFATGTRAAALGGTTTVIDFVEPEPGEPLLEALEKRRVEADGRVAIDYSLHMTIPTWHAAHPGSLADLPQVVEAGLSSFKLYMAYEGFRLDDVQLLDALSAIRDAGGLAIVHCENGPLLEHLRERAVARGRTAPPYHAATRPPRQEAEAVSRLIDIASLAECPVYVAHVSCRGPLERIETARARGDTVYAETCPQYLLLDNSALEGSSGERMICAPPLRTAADQDALWDGLRRGILDVVSTDHCPFTAAEKAGHADFTTAPGGLPSIEARIALVHDGLEERGLTVEDWVRVCSARSAALFGLDTKGCIAVGLDADLVLFDPQRQVTIEAGETLHERVDWSPYAGRRVRGWTRDVILRGEPVVEGGRFVGQQGAGRFVRRGRPEPLDEGAGRDAGTDAFTSRPQCAKSGRHPDPPTPHI
jgi:dihydropyrimidinase